MVRPEGFFPARQGAPVERLGPVVVAYVAQENPEAADTPKRIEMLRPEGFFPALQSAAVECLGRLPQNLFPKPRSQFCDTSPILPPIGQLPELWQPIADESFPPNRPRHLIGILLALVEALPEKLPQCLCGRFRIREVDPRTFRSQPFPERFVEEAETTVVFDQITAEQRPGAHGGLAIPGEDFAGEVERQRTGRGHHQTQERLHGLAKIRAEARLEGGVVAAVESGQTGFKSLQSGGLEGAFAQPLGDEAQVEHHARAFFDEQGAEPFAIFRREQWTDFGGGVGLQIGLVAGVSGLDREGLEALQVGDDRGVGAARHDKADPVGQFQKSSAEEGGERVGAVGFDGFVEGIDEDNELVLAPDQARHRIGDEEGKEIAEVLFAELLPRFFDALGGGVGKEAEPRQEARAVVVPPQGELAGDRADGPQRITQLHALVIAEPRADDRGAVTLRHLHGEGGLAKAGPRLHPEDPRGGLVVEPVLVGVEDPLASGEAHKVSAEAPLER
jgi:hypothetical protein